MNNAPRPQVESIPVAKLTVDPDVQRAVDTVRVGRMVKNYRADALGVLVVSRREDGTYHVIDGQHRLAATIAAGYGDRNVDALVYERLTRADEAAMFRLLNDASKVNPVDRFRVRVVEGDEVAVTLDQILRAHGWRVYQGKSAGMFAAVAALEKVYRGEINGDVSPFTVCDGLIRMITEAWGHDAKGVRNEIVGGLGAVLRRYSAQIDTAKLTNELAQVTGGPLGLVGKAKGLHGYRGGTLADAMAEVIVELHNKKRGGANRLPDWRAS